VKIGTPLVQLYDAPDQGDLSNFKAQATVAQLSLDRAKQLAARQFGPQATVDTAQAAFDQPRPASPRRKRSFRRRWCARHSTANSACVTSSRSVPHRRHPDRVADRSVGALCELHGHGKRQWKPEGRQTVRVKVDAYPGRIFEGKISTIEPQIASDTRNIRVQATIANPITS